MYVCVFLRFLAKFQAIYHPCGKKAWPVLACRLSVVQLHMRNSAVVIITFSSAVYCFILTFVCVGNELVNTLIDQSV